MQTSKRGGNMQSRPLTQGERSVVHICICCTDRRGCSGVTVLQWHITCLWRDWAWTGGPCIPFLNLLSKSLQVGLESWGLLFHGVETLQHLVKLQGERSFLNLAGFLAHKQHSAACFSVPAQCWTEATALARLIHCCCSHCCSCECDSRLIPMEQGSGAFWVTTAESVISGFFYSMWRTLPAGLACYLSGEPGRTEVCSCSDPTLQTKSLPNT